MTGICFGHQIIAEALGGKTERSTKGWGIGLRESHVVDPEFESILDKYTIISIVPVLPSTIIKCFFTAPGTARISSVHSQQPCNRYAP
jgi:gamma-glutamyl-gamma-aminobutyrate hydrolase PuuD